ncbi:MAG: 6-bladed beta-propeller [Tannerella sp.]|jgi:hypothetical protein|nr:6-bladed beta-propeller [Tannerella sp.]
MKKTSTILAIILSVTAGCGGGKQSATTSDDFITVDVTAKYPKKELILQDFMDVEYIPLETNDDFLCQGLVQAIGREIILVKNRVDDGDIFIFDRNGKAIKKINRKGQGGEEYTYILGIALDEDNGEMFVNDHYKRKIFVYDLDGNFKRSFQHKDDAMYIRIFNFDRENLICDDGQFSDDGTANRLSFRIISKLDGSVTKEIQIPFEKKILTVLILKDEASKMTYSASPSHQPFIPSFNSWILVEPSSDTLYSYSPDHRMTPFIARTPPVQSMDPEVFLFPNMITDRYYFIETVKKVYDFGKRQGFPSTDLMYDRQEKAIFKYTVYNDDYSDKRPVYMKSQPVNDEIATWQRIDAHRLVEANDKGELKGRLKEIAAELDEESNPVIMLVKHKK